MNLDKHTHTHSPKGQILCLGPQDLPRENIDQEKGSDAKCGLKVRWLNGTASYLYSERLPSYKYWREEPAGRGGVGVWGGTTNGASEKWHT